MPEDHFGEEVAGHYDADLDEMFSDAVLEPAVSFLAELAGSGPVLEFGIGTGRVALPLAARGVLVAGVDLSEAMVRRLRVKPGGQQLDVVIGDFATVRVEGRFSLVYLVFNTINNLTTQDEQVACFQNAAAHLAPAGLFVIEVSVPQLQRLAPGERTYVFDRSESHAGIDELDLVTQAMISHHYTRRGDGSFEYTSGPFRYVWPSELDLMARLAGLQFCERWADWGRQPFTAESPSHVSVWQKPAGPANGLT
ncbi:MAG TPA: class I SAM-dependent methyltransferase [Solirubrobacteraceae bacterium]|nr:class I SAM-dependent methyltransferase [Solirubrobacteraceae bacterium]